jgi:hypothetical protein
VIHPLASRRLVGFWLRSTFPGGGSDLPEGHGQSFPFAVLIVLATVWDIPYAKAFSRPTWGRHDEVMAKPETCNWILHGAAAGMKHKSLFSLEADR